jgi:S1-C subfamily serine protease
MLGVAVSGSRIPTIGPLVRDSVVLAKVNQVMPRRAQRTLQAFDDLVGSSFFPRYLEPFAPERIVTVGPAPTGIVKDPDVQKAQLSVFKVRSSNKCGEGVEGTGFLYAPRRLMTNAHVVAGVKEPKVKVGSRTVSATTVYYNPRLDVAVLSVPELSGPTLRFNPNGKARQNAVVLGFPQDGPFDAQPAKIRSQQRLRSPDIYGSNVVTREVYSLRSLIRPGNSGGPVVSLDGRVLGVIFAASVTDTDTGYALTADQVAEAAAQGLTHDGDVDTGACA